MQPGNSYTRGICTYSYPHTVENGARERITFVQCVQDPAGDRLEVENHLKPGSGPQINIHNQHPSHARRCGFFVAYEADVENRLLGGTGVEPTQIHESRNPQPLELRFRVLLTEGGTQILFNREAVRPVP